MADYVATMDALRGHLEDGFADLPLYWPNGDDTPELQDAPSGFVYSEISVSGEQPVTIGTSRRHRDSGEMRIFVYVPRGSKVGAAEAHAEAIRSLFGVNAIADLTIETRTIGNGETVAGPDGKWYAVPVVVQFRTDRIE